MIIIWLFIYHVSSQIRLLKNLIYGYIIAMVFAILLEDNNIKNMNTI